MPRLPQRRDIWFVPVIEHTNGTEVKTKRPWLVISDPINLYGSETVIAAGITQGGSGPRNLAITVSLHGMNLKTTGVVLCHQIRTIDLISIQAEYVETVPVYLIDAVIEKLSLIIEA